MLQQGLTRNAVKVLTGCHLSDWLHGSWHEHSNQMKCEQTKQIDRKTAETQFQQQLCCQNQHQNFQMISQDPIDWPLDNLQSSLLLRWWPWVLGCGGLNKIDVGLPTHTGGFQLIFKSHLDHIRFFVKYDISYVSIYTLPFIVSAAFFAIGVFIEMFKDDHWQWRWRWKISNR